MHGRGRIVYFRILYPNLLSQTFEKGSARRLARPYLLARVKRYPPIAAANIARIANQMPAPTESDATPDVSPVRGSTVARPTPTQTIFNIIWFTSAITLPPKTAPHDIWLSMMVRMSSKSLAHNYSVRFEALANRLVRMTDMSDERSSNDAGDCRLEILCQSATATEPTKSLFDEPSAWQNLEALCTVGPLDDFCLPFSDTFKA